MSLPTRSIGKRIALRTTLPALMLIAMVLFPLCVSAEENCREVGMTVGNQTMRDLWVTGTSGRCILWRNHQLLRIKPGATVIIYRDMTCQTEYCSMRITFDDLTLIDIDRNCRVRILPDCNFSDM